MAVGMKLRTLKRVWMRVRPRCAAVFVIKLITIYFDINSSTTIGSHFISSSCSFALLTLF